MEEEDVIREDSFYNFLQAPNADSLAALEEQVFDYGRGIKKDDVISRRVFVSMVRFIRDVREQIEA